MSDTERFNFSTGNDDRTQEWIMTGGGSQKKFSGMQYQDWSSGIDRPDRFDELLDCGEEQNGGSGNLSSVASKLDPNSKPFAPRQPPFPPAKTAVSPTTYLDENENKVDNSGNNNEKLRQIWAKTNGSSPPSDVPQERQSPPPPRIDPREMQRMISNALSYDMLPKSGNNREFQSPPAISKDDFGLRSLMRNIKISASSLRSEESSVLSNDDLGMSQVHRAFFKERKLAYPYLESPLNNNIVSPLSDYVHVPDEYAHGLAARQALPKLELNKLATDLLFYLFYVAVGDAMQLQAANELFTRGWRYNTSLKLWVARLPSVNPDMRHKTYEKGLYQYFNPSTWRRETKTMTLYYAELAMENKH